MTKEQTTSGGIHLGNVGGNASFQAGGDIVGNDKTTTTTTGFRDEAQKHAFLQQLEALREGLRELRTQVDAVGELDADEKDDLVREIAERLKALRDVKDLANEVKPGSAPDSDLADKLDTGLAQTGKVLEKWGKVAAGAVDLRKKLGELAAQYGPALLALRHLFGLP